MERPGLDSGYGFQAPGMILKAAKIERQGLHDPSFGLLERPKLTELIEPRLGLAGWVGWGKGIGFRSLPLLNFPSPMYPVSPTFPPRRW